MMAAIHQIADLNNKGVLLLSQGMSSLAFSAFKDAVRAFKSEATQDVVVRQQQQTTPPPDDRREIEVLHRHLYKSEQSVFSLSNARFSHEIPMSHERRYFVFDRAITLLPVSTRKTHLPAGLFEEPPSSSFSPFHTTTPQLNSEDVSDDHQPHILRRSPNIEDSAIILFNMALAYHCRGGRSADIHKFMVRALNLYDKILAVLVTRQLRNQNVEYEDTCCILIAAARNNKALIEYELGDYHQSRLTLDELECMLFSEESRLVQCLAPEFIDGFMHNIMFLQPPSTAAAA